MFTVESSSRSRVEGRREGMEALGQTSACRLSYFCTHLPRSRFPQSMNVFLKLSFSEETKRIRSRQSSIQTKKYPVCTLVYASCHVLLFEAGNIINGHR